MQISFCYSHLDEYRRLLYTLYSIETGFFKDAGMYLSYEYGSLPNTVIIPKLKVLTQKGFWENYKKIKKEIPKNYPNYSGSEFKDLFKIIATLTPIDITETEKNWSSVAGSFEDILTSLFELDLQEVAVFVTHFGTVSSYNHPTPRLRMASHSGKKLNIYLRKDADISQIAFCILSFFIHKYKGNLTWREQQRAVDFLLLNTKLKKIFPKFVSILDSSLAVETDIALVLNSEQIYKDLGICTNSAFATSDGKIYVYGEEIATLTKPEKLVFCELIKNKKRILTFDNISTILWGSDFSAFSLQAIAKTIERIRAKVTNAGINRQVIFTKRKQGYVLID